MRISKRKAKKILSIAVILLVIALAAPWIKRHSESVQCGNDMVSICIAAQQWAFEHDGHFPSDFTFLSKYTTNPDILICPGDHVRQPAKDWASFTLANSSYEIVTPNLLLSNPDGIFLRCKVHHHIGFANAEVFDGVRRRTKVMW